MQKYIRKSWNNTLCSPVCKIKDNLDKIVHFLVKENHHLHNSVTELDITKIDIALSSMFHHSAPADNHAYVFDILNFPNGSFNTYQTQSIHI